MAPLPPPRGGPHGVQYCTSTCTRTFVLIRVYKMIRDRVCARVEALPPAPGRPRPSLSPRPVVLGIGATDATGVSFTLLPATEGHNELVI